MASLAAQSRPQLGTEDQSSLLDLSKLMQLELGGAATIKSPGGITATHAAGSTVISASSGHKVAVLQHSSSSTTTDDAVSSSTARPEPDDELSKDSRFSMLNPFDLLTDGGSKQLARQLSNSSSNKQSAGGKPVSTKPAPAAARSSCTYVYYGKEEPVCGRCGVHGHKTGVCIMKFCQRCSKFGHADGNCKDACPSCGRFHKHRQPGYDCNGDRCPACGLYGHFKWACPNIACTECGNLGHRKRECQGNSSSTSSSTLTTPRSPTLKQQTATASWNRIKLRKDLPQEQLHQQGQQLLWKLQPLAPNYSQALAQNPHKLAVLSRISPADVMWLLRQPDVAEQLDEVYTHCMEGAASAVKPHQLQPEHVRQFEAAMQEIAPRFLPANWHQAELWPKRSDVLGRLGRDRAHQFKQAKFQVQLAVYKSLTGTGSRQQQHADAKQANAARLPAQEQQQQLTSNEHFPPLQSAGHIPGLLGSCAAAAAVQRPTGLAQQQQQQPVVPRITQQQQQQQGAGDQLSAAGPQQEQHYNQQHQNTAAVSMQLPGLVAAICSSLHSMLAQMRDGQVQLEQPFAEQLLHVAELAGRAKQLTDLQQQSPAGASSAASRPPPQDPATVRQPLAAAVAQQQHVALNQAGFALKGPAAAAAAAAGVGVSEAGHGIEDEDDAALLGLLMG